MLLSLCIASSLRMTPGCLLRSSYSTLFAVFRNPHDVILAIPDCVA